MLKLRIDFLHTDISNNVFFFSFSQSSQVVHGAFIEPEHRIRKRSINQQLRISLVYDLSVYRLDDDKFALVNVSMAWVGNVMGCTELYGLVGNLTKREW